MGFLNNAGVDRVWKKFKEHMVNYVSSRGENLITNGTCMLGDNTNFSRFTYDGSDTYYSGGSFKLVSKNTMINNDEFIPVDTSAKYLLSYYIKSDNADAHYYDMLVMYDIDKREIRAENVMWIVGSTTKLAKELKNGDTVVYLEDASGFDKTTAKSYQRGLIFWNYQNSKGYTYGTETYSRNIWDALWDDGNAIDTTNNTITLKNPWNHGILPEGTPVSQCSYGITYTYMNSGYAIPTGKWVQKKGSISGIGKCNEYYKFREGTAFIKIGWYLPYECETQTTTWLSTISLTQNANIIDVDSAIKELKKYVDSHSSGGLTLDKVYPIGSVYISANGANPNAIIGGTWEEFATGRTLIGYDPSDNDFTETGMTGGEKTHVLTVDELPEHNHDVTVENKELTGSVWNFVGQNAKFGPGNSTSGVFSKGGDGTCFYPSSTGKAVGVNDGFMLDATHDHTATSGNTGSGTAHNNMMPYITVRMWKRTA